MGRKAKYSKELKIEIIKRYLNGESATSLANEYNMPKSMSDKIITLAHRYEVLGERGFESSNTNKSYSKELKEQVIKEYLSGKETLTSLANKYNISTAEIVRNWVLKYNEGIEIKDYDPKGDVYTMKARKTTFEERLEIVNYVLTNDNDYKGAADKYSVPYASVYQWVLKYSKYGEDGLKDRRGRPSSKEPQRELTNEDKQAIEIEKLKRELERSKMVIEVLKKKHRNTRTNGARFSKVIQEDKYEAIDGFKDKPGFTIDFLCKTLEIPRSSYYKWKNRVKPEKEQRDEMLAQLIYEYNESYKGILGYRRMTMYINILNNTSYFEKYIHRLMKVIGIHARIRRKKSNYIKSKPDQVGMSRVGKCIDNGPMEAFWGTLKSEMFYGIIFEDEASISEAIKNYIDFYNNGRFQTKLKGLTPSQFGNSVNPNLLPLVI